MIIPVVHRMFYVKIKFLPAKEYHGAPLGAAGAA